MVVYSGVDLQFNQLRVLPPFELQDSYPDMLRDKKRFYSMIGCQHLAHNNKHFKAIKGLIFMKLRFAYEGS